MTYSSDLLLSNYKAKVKSLLCRGFFEFATCYLILNLYQYVYYICDWYVWVCTCVYLYIRRYYRKFLQNEIKVNLFWYKSFNIYAQFSQYKFWWAFEDFLTFNFKIFLQHDCFNSIFHELSEVPVLMCAYLDVHAAHIDPYMKNRKKDMKYNEISG